MLCVGPWRRLLPLSSSSSSSSPPPAGDVVVRRVAVNDPDKNKDFSVGNKVDIALHMVELCAPESLLAISAPSKCLLRVHHDSANHSRDFHHEWNADDAASNCVRALRHCGEGLYGGLVAEEGGQA